jgi:hypothetical protein
MEDFLICSGDPHAHIALVRSKVMRSLFAIVAVVWAFSSAHALTHDEIRAKLESAGYTQIREVPSGKIKIFKAVKDGRERSLIVDSTGHIIELQ